MPTAAAISAIRMEASEGTNDCGERNRITVKAMRAQKGTTLAGLGLARPPSGVGSSAAAGDARHQSVCEGRAVIVRTSRAAAA